MMKEFVWAAIYFCGGAVVSLGLYALIAGGATQRPRRRSKWLPILTLS